MADPTSPNLGIPYPIGTDQVSAGPSNFQNLVNAMDAGTNGPTMTRIVSGTLATFTATYQSSPASFALGTVFACTDVDCFFVRDSTPAWRSAALNFHTVPIGSLHAYAAPVGGTFLNDPDGVARWRLCDGGAISRTTYAAYFGVAGTTFGTGDGSTTFNVPDLRGRVPVGADTGGVHLPTNHPTLGGSGGEESHTLSGTEMPSHSHTGPSHTHTFAGGQIVPVSSGGFSLVSETASGGTFVVSASVSLSGVTSTDAAGTGATGNAGSGATHNNLQPYQAVNYLVKVL